MVGFLSLALFAPGRTKHDTWTPSLHRWPFAGPSQVPFVAGRTDKASGKECPLWDGPTCKAGLRLAGWVGGWVRG